MSFCSSKVNRKSENSQFTKEENDQEKLTTLWSRTLRSTTSVLTATVLVYAAGAGITAAAGTRLAFQSILIAVFGYSIHRKPHSPDRVCGVTTFRRCLANNFIGIGQFARLLPTLVVVAIFQAPSPESNPYSPLPVIAMVVLYTTINS